jgi:predicted RNase H-like nuclease
VLLIGLDAASDFSKFGYAVGYYEDGRVRIKQAGLVDTPSERNALVSVVAPELRSASRALIAIDAPLGWPAALAAELCNHQAGEAFASDKNSMFRRATDNYVRDLTKKNPLEVGADKIARAAHSALAALKCLRAASEMAIPLAWDKNFTGMAAIEVYPAGTLKERGLPDSKYKKPEQLNVRLDIANSLANDIDGLTTYVDGSADIFDACLCLVAAKDFIDGLAEPPIDHPLALREGWIWIRNPSGNQIS